MNYKFFRENEGKEVTGEQLDKMLDNMCEFDDVVKALKGTEYEYIFEALDNDENEIIEFLEEEIESEKYIKKIEGRK
jgi:hypothetical protein